MTQVHVLTMLEHHGEMPMSRLAEMLGVSLSNASGLIDRLEEARLVERIRDGEDRRVVLVRAADSGRQALHEVQLMRDDLMRRLLGRLDADQLTRIELAMADMRDAVTAEARAGVGGREHLHPHVTRGTEKGTDH
jgi:DNA-binding MarR family transcriptional regulator